MSARSLALALSWLAAWVLSGAAQAAAPVGQPAPELTGRDTRGIWCRVDRRMNSPRNNVRDQRRPGNPDAVHFILGRRARPGGRLIGWEG